MRSALFSINSLRRVSAVTSMGGRGQLLNESTQETTVKMMAKAWQSAEGNEGGGGTEQWGRDPQLMPADSDQSAAKMREASEPGTFVRKVRYGGERGTVTYTGHVVSAVVNTVSCHEMNRRLNITNQRQDSGVVPVSSNHK